jgi:hypothetical protein
MDEKEWKETFMKKSKEKKKNGKESEKRKRMEPTWPADRVKSEVFHVRDSAPAVEFPFLLPPLPCHTFTYLLLVSLFFGWKIGGREKIEKK